jgi:hypothetical protein
VASGINCPGWGYSLVILNFGGYVTKETLLSRRFFRAARKFAHSVRQSEEQASCCNAFRGSVSMDLGIFRGAF